MKIVSISDTHGYLPELPECDVVCICGDILPLHIQRDFENSLAWMAGPFQSWALNLKCQKVIFIAGNHDFILEKLWKGGLRQGPEPHWTMYWDTKMIHDTVFQLDDDRDPKIIYLQDSSYTYNGVKFYGTPWCPNLANWAFYANSEDLKINFAAIHPDTDVLLTHCPPKYGLQGVVLENNWNHMSDFGCVELQQALDDRFSNKDMWVLSGHIHSGKHDVEVLNNIKYRNCSLKDEDYRESYQPFEFEI